LTTVTFLGTGTSQGVPFIGCTCAVCSSTDPKDKRLRSAIWIKSDTTSVIIDTGPDFRYQMLRAQVPHIDAVVYTHGHKDHVAGLDDIRAYNYWQESGIDLYADTFTTEVLKREFHYAFSGVNYPGIPVLNIKNIEASQCFTIGDLIFQPIQVMHYKLPVLGFRIGNFTYITDANFIETAELEKIKGSEILVLNALRREQHISHFTLEEAIATAQSLEVPQTFFTHASHQLGLHHDLNAELPLGIQMAYDGLTLTIDPNL
jgi:phosphoribosyl 1,2-cyclic phosphate phosphodiesterase